MMRAKLIYEKFTEESDPINDLGIGIEHQIKEWIKTLGSRFSLDNEEILALSAEHGKTEFVKYLLEKNVNVHIANEYALRHAIMNGHIEIVKLLLNAGANLTPGMMTFVFEMAKKRGHDYIIKIVQEHMNKQNLKESLNEKFTEESDPIHDLGIGIEHQIENWVSTTSEIDRYTNRDDILWICAKHGKTEFVEYLLKKGVDVNYRSDFALRWAAKYNHIEVVKLLLKAGANVYAFDQEAIKYAKQHKDQTLYNIIKKHIRKIKKPKNIYEKFTEDSDPIADLGIGFASIHTEEQLKKIYPEAKKLVSPHINYDTYKLNNELYARVKYKLLVYAGNDDYKKKFDIMCIYRYLKNTYKQEIIWLQDI